MNLVEVKYDSDEERNLVALTVTAISQQIDEKLPAGRVVPQHTDAGHFYAIYDKADGTHSAVYESVSKKINAVKDESIQNFSMNEALRTVEAGLGGIVVNGQIDLMKATDLLFKAKHSARDVMRNAGAIGTAIHDRREEYMQDWIDLNTIEQRPDINDYIRPDDDPRLVAGMNGLEKFIIENRYVPIRTEVMVYSHTFKTAGMLDDIGIMFKKNRKRGGNWRFVLMDLKTSNQFKAHYWLQVAMYYLMFLENTGLKPDDSLILKVFKDRPVYKLEYLKKMPRLVAGVKNVFKVEELMKFIKLERKTKTYKI